MNPRPTIHTITERELQLPAPVVHTLSGGIPLYEVRMGTQDALRLDVIFRAGRSRERKKLAARATARLLREGTRRYSGAAIAEQTDFLGAYLNSTAGMDHARFSILCLSRHLEQLLPLLADMLTEPTFPEEELQAYIRRNCQRLSVDLSQSEVVAYREITSLIFGAEHPYGYNSTEALYRSLKREDLLEHFRAHYRAGNCVLFLGGKTEPRHVEAVDRLLAAALPEGNSPHPQLPPHDYTPQRRSFPLPDAAQTSVRIGRPLFPRRHPDYFGFTVLNTLFGGYFGSRLMTNIREGQGLTYNISSTMEFMVFDGCFYVATEVANGQAEHTIREVFAEMEKLCEEPVSEAELGMVKNYLTGNMLNMIDGPFNTLDALKSLTLQGLRPTHFQEHARRIRSISPDDIQELARRYLQPATMSVVVAGPA